MNRPIKCRVADNIALSSILTPLILQSVCLQRTCAFAKNENFIPLFRPVTKISNTPRASSEISRLLTVVANVVVTELADSDSDLARVVGGRNL